MEETNGRSIEPQLLEERARLSGLLGDGAACERGLALPSATRVVRGSNLRERAAALGYAHETYKSCA